MTIEELLEHAKNFNPTEEDMIEHLKRLEQYDSPPKPLDEDKIYNID
jgi:hypothetical protein